MCRSNNLVKKLISVPLFSLLLSCSTTYYAPQDSEQMATVSFSSLSNEIPEIHIVNNCKSERIDNVLIEKKKPQEKSEFKTKIPAGKNISFKYNYNWILTEENNLTSEGLILNTVPIIKTKASTKASSCTSLVSFTPEANQHYDVYFAISGKNCQIKASKSVTITDSKNNLYAIPLSNKDTCSN